MTSKLYLKSYLRNSRYMLGLMFCISFFNIILSFIIALVGGADLSNLPYALKINIFIHALLLPLYVIFATSISDTVITLKKLILFSVPRHTIIRSYLIISFLTILTSSVFLLIIIWVSYTDGTILNRTVLNSSPLESIQMVLSLSIFVTFLFRAVFLMFTVINIYLTLIFTSALGTSIFFITSAFLKSYNPASSYYILWSLIAFVGILLAALSGFLISKYQLKH